MYRKPHTSGAALLALLIFMQLWVPSQAKAQLTSSIVTGIVKGVNNEPLVGVSVVVRNKKTNFTSGTRTDTSGVFTLSRIPAGGPYSFSFTMVGYEAQTLSGYTLKEGTTFSLAVSMKTSSEALDQVVVTGVFDKRKRMEASVAISTISAQQISKITPMSAADLLKNVPGVYVNSSLGEIRNTVYSRGVSVGSNDGASGYYYVSMQEDGLPVTNATYTNYGPDYFLRPDATIGRVEAVRGGTASILGANAPGGIFNYVMKEGGEKTAGEVVTKYGLEGNGKNSYYRADFNVGGSVGKSWYWDAGGFYRYDQGARYPGYALNNGGQFRANVIKKYATGSVKVYAKYLNDHNGWFEFTPTVGYSDPKPAQGFSETSSVLMPPVRQSFMINQTGQVGTYDNKDLIHSIDKTIGGNWEQHLGGGWTFNNAIRYSNKSAYWNTNAVVYPLDMSNLISYAVLGLLGQPGTYSFRNVNSGQELLKVQSFSGFDFNVLNNSLPGGEVAPNSLFFEPLLYNQNAVKEFLDQYSLTKRTKNMSFTIGGFYGHSKIDHLSGGAGLALGTIKDRPDLVNIVRTNPDGTITHFTNSNGVSGIGGGLTQNYGTQNQSAIFFGHNWQINSALNLDWGVRWESVGVKGQNSLGVTAQSTTGGADGDPLTLYDNSIGSAPNTYFFDKTVHTFSYSAGLNYKINDNLALYGRVSEGNKAPDMDMYFSATTEFLAKTLEPHAQKVRQFEAGIKARAGKLNLFVTPFYSVLSNVAGVQTFTNTDQTTYNAPTVFNKYRTMGVETEIDYGFAKYFHLRGVLTFQKSKALDFNAWLGRNLGPQDDTLVTFSGNETDNIARSIINITPSYNRDQFFAQLTWSFMGKRQANVANAFLIPSFSQFNFSTGYDLSRHFSLGLVINNIFNTYGVMSWSRPGAFLEALDRQGFTKEMYDDAVKKNRPYSTIAIQPRAYFISGTFRF